MKSTTSTCTADYLVRCANCQRWVKAGSPIVTTVMPGRVTVAHEECPLREESDAEKLAARVNRFSTDRERWTEDHWDYVERIGAE